MQDVRGIDFQGYRVADSCGRRHGCLSRIRRSLPGYGYPPGGNQFLAFVFGKGNPAPGGQGGRRLFLLRGHCRRPAKTLGLPPVAPLMIVQQGAHSESQLVRDIKNRYLRRFQLGQTGGSRPGSRPEKSQSPVALIPLGDNLFRLGIRPGAGYHQRPDMGLLAHISHNFREGFAVGEPGNIGGIGGPAKPFQNAVNALPGGIGQRRQIQPGLSAHIGGQGADAARVGNYGNARLNRLGAMGQQLGHFQQLVIILNPGNAVLGKDFIIKGIGSGQGGGMGTGGPGAQVGTANLNQYDGLAAFRRQFGHGHQFAGILETLDKAGKDLDRILIQQVAGKIAKIQVSLVAGGNDMAEADALLDGPGQKGAKGRGPALADKTDRAAEPIGTPGGGGGPDVGLHISHP